jgi:hypothetical protein
VISENFEELTQRIENSQLLAYVFESKQLRFQLYHMKSARLYSFSAPTDTVHGRTVSSTITRSTCSIRLVDLEDAKLLLNDAKERITLAYGRRRDDYRWLVNLQGEYTLLSFLVGDLSEIRWEVE